MSFCLPLRPAAHIAALAVLCAAPLLAQQTINNASLGGRVVDPTGASIAHAAITAHNVDRGIDTPGTTDAAGRFRFAYLPIGAYTVTATAPGFHAVTRAVALTAGAEAEITLPLPVSGPRETITLAEDPLAASATTTQSSSTIEAAEVTELPYLSRNFLDLAVLAPGVSATNTNATQLFAETSAVPGQGLSVNSQRNFSNSFLIDGLSANDDAAGLVTTVLPLEAVAELQVVTSGGQAEFGRALGGYFNFVTHSGSNVWHGTGYGFLRNQRLNAANALALRQVPLTQAQFGGSAGGPLRHERTFVFANAEARNLNQDANTPIVITPANAAAINARLTATSYAGPLLSIDPSTAATLYANPVHAQNVFARLDHHFTAADSFAARYSFYHVSAQNSRGAGGLNYTSAAAALFDTDQTIALSNIFVLSPRIANETRAQFTHSRLDAPVNDNIGPAVSISGVAAFGTLSGSPTARYDDLYELVDNFSVQRGAHALRAGADFLFNNLTITFPQSARGSYAFSSLKNFQSGTYSTFTQSFGNAIVPQTNPNLGLFLQDEWRATPALTVNAGVRYDLQFLQAVNTATANVAPRAGIAWSPRASTVVRASYGYFFDRVPLRALSNALESNGNTTTLNAQTFVTLALSYGQTGAPTFPAIASGYNATNLPANIRLSLTTMDPNLPNASAQQASFEVEQQISADFDFKAGFQHVRGEHLLISVNRNAPSCLSSTDPINLCRPVSTYANNKQYAGAADSMYDGLALSLRRRSTRFGSVRISYTWSHALDDVSEFFFSAPINNFDISEDWSRSDDDQRHRLTLDGIVHAPAASATRPLDWLTRNWQLSGVLQYTSALPYNITTGGQTVQTTTQRPCAAGSTLGGITPCTLALRGYVLGRNAGTGFAYFNLNARLSRSFALRERLHMEAIAQAFNALNHRNDLVPNATSATAVATAVADPRSVEFGLRLRF
jgi:hypothetical protein